MRSEGAGLGMVEFSETGMGCCNFFEYTIMQQKSDLRGLSSCILKSNASPHDELWCARGLVVNNSHVHHTFLGYRGCSELIPLIISMRSMQCDSRKLSSPPSLQPSWSQQRVLSNNSTPASSVSPY